MKIIKNFLAISSLLILITGCATQTFSVNPSVKREVPAGNPHFSRWSHFFFLGVGQSDFKNATDLCKDNGGVSFVETKQLFVQGLIAAVSYGIYAPRLMNIYCIKE